MTDDSIVSACGVHNCGCPLLSPSVSLFVVLPKHGGLSENRPRSAVVAGLFSSFVVAVTLKN